MTQPADPVQPAMYVDAGDGTLDLLFLECGHCGSLSFPASAYGCRQCGAPAEAGRTARRPGRARLRQFATVHQNLSPALPAPYVVGELELAPGLVEEGVLGVADEAGLQPGMAMRAVPVTTADGRYACRFVPAGEAA
ncbi:hypothetical protein FOZ76_06200 [Verticiella sediminum]|uniref:ChsH2 C-terminal OB-fold domain-containing protein n=1 Tax=Verticiella sediminum TaxID=1247510 RepID=A0A556AWI8_9BURK|nr:OB-fold domain-containing protein [Verticiella sediminum]TSH97318.1 hypothetical protein FOZ76_06200 [Verticiella sediminum]